MRSKTSVIIVEVIGEIRKTGLNAAVRWQIRLLIGSAVALSFHRRDNVFDRIFASIDDLVRFRSPSFVQLQKNLFETGPTVHAFAGRGKIGSSEERLQLRSQPD